MQEMRARWRAVLEKAALGSEGTPGLVGHIMDLVLGRPGSGNRLVDRNQSRPGRRVAGIPAGPYHGGGVGPKGDGSEASKGT